MPAPTSTAQGNQAAAVTTTVSASQEEPKKEDEQKKRSVTPEKKVKVAKKIVKVSKHSHVAGGASDVLFY